MRIHRPRRAVLVALTVLVALAAVIPVSPADARSRSRKIEPRRMTPYRVGRAFTPNTDVVSASGYAAWMIDEVLGATTPLPRLGSAFMQAERREGINARYFVAHALLESGWGTSDIARLKHNLFGYGAYDRDPWRHALRFRTYEQGILAVAGKIRDRYLRRGGRWWYGFTTLRGMNRYYASDVHWADKIAVLANALDKLVVTLKERGLQFGQPRLEDAAIVKPSAAGSPSAPPSSPPSASPADGAPPAGMPLAGSKVALRVPWKAKPGAELPGAIRFAVRWTPIALVESSSGEAPPVPAFGWTPALRADLPGHVVRLASRAPSLPGLWRLDVEARDSDGRPLPPSDDPRVPPLTVRVVAEHEASVGLSIGRSGALEATVGNPGRVRIEAARAGSPTVVEAWALPLDAKVKARRLAAVKLRAPLAAGKTLVVRFEAPAVPSVVVVRLAGGAGAVGAGRPAAGLVTRDGDGRLALTPLTVASPRDDALLARKPGPGRISLTPAKAPGGLNASVVGGVAAPAMAPAVAAMEGVPGRPWLMIRSLAADSWRAADPSGVLLQIPAEPPTPARVQATGLPGGVRLVVAGIVAPDGSPVDPGSLYLAWIPIAAADGTDVVPH